VTDNTEFDQMSATSSNKPVCESFESSLGEIKNMIKKKKDVYAILEKIVLNLSACHERCCSNLASVREESIKNYVKLAKKHAELDDHSKKVSQSQEANSERIESLEIAQKCSTEGTMLYMSFTDPREVEALKSKSKDELKEEAWNIFARMDIDVDDPCRAILDAYLKTLPTKCGTKVGSELVLCLQFSSVAVTADMKKLVSRFGKQKFLEKDFDKIRYHSRDNWSVGVLNPLKVCYDLQSFNLIQYVNVKDGGIAVTYSYKTNGISCRRTSLIRTEADLNKLRMTVGDVCSHLSTYQLYTEAYFKLGRNARMKIKESYKLMDDRREPLDKSPILCEE
jgi:hypothetical protein